MITRISLHDCFWPFFVFLLARIYCGQNKNLFWEAASNGDGTVRIWDLFRRQISRSFKGHSEPILTSTALDWIYLATSSNRDILIWNTQNASLVKNLTGHSDYVYHLMKMQNGLLLSASADKTIKACTG
jgi:WD40 repeat protein